MTRPIGLAHLTLLRLSPPELVTTAAAAGYDFVGIRVKAVTAGERHYAMEPGSPLSRETLARLRDTGLEVRDVEFLPLGPDTGRDDWMPALEAEIMGMIAGGGYQGPGKSPDRADAMVWGVGEVMRGGEVRVRGV